MIRFKTFIKESNKIPGGLSDGMSLTDIAKKHNVSIEVIKKNLKQGIKVEMEHTSSKSIAKEIAMDHIAEKPDYYDRLKKVEEEADKSQKPLNKPFKTPGGPKKSSVYVKNDKGNVVKVNFGDPNMSIKKHIPARRKSFRARHNCEDPGPKWKARYWSCKAW